MKKLVYEYNERIEKRKVYVNQLVDGLNTVLNRFRESHNHFSQPIDEAFAWQLVADSVGSFDELLRVNSPIKPVAGKPLDLVKVAELTGIDRPAWLAACTVLIPGSVDNFNRAGRHGILKLSPVDRALVICSGEGFAVNEAALLVDLEKFRVYAESKDQLAELDYWQGLAELLTRLVDRKSLLTYEAHQLSRIIPMLLVESKPGTDKFWFAPDYAKLATTIQQMSVN